MPQARRAGSSPSNPSAQKSTSARPAAGKPAPARSAAASAGRATPAAPAPAAAEPAAKPASARRATASKPAAKKTAASKPATSKATASKPAAKKATASKPATEKATASKNGGAAKGAGSTSRPRVNIDAAQVEAISQRLRKLNEKIIDFGREAGEQTLASYEKALKTIANGVQQSSAKDELEWISQLAASQAKFVREITDSWAKAARDRLK
jgi:hypothetical protein